MRRFTLLAALAAAPLTLSGCQTAEFNQTAMDRQRPATEAEVNGVLKGMRDSLRDPYSVRDAEISNVFELKSVGSQPDQHVCVKGNTRNGFGAYTGRQTYLVYLRNGVAFGVNQDIFAQSLCNRVGGYRPFTEVRRLSEL
ncbi:hypothetical protein [Aureimonas sp. D3]|uniref:hypothetical protein n=1 Tax=Aureimonas sp. D3 TaxID=1638164 RepID=UPI0012E3B6AB|nr:hypothetical protein [Aureimonas sp. D3]